METSFPATSSEHPSRELDLKRETDGEGSRRRKKKEKSTRFARKAAIGKPQLGKNEVEF